MLTQKRSDELESCTSELLVRKKAPYQE